MANKVTRPAGALLGGAFGVAIPPSMTAIMAILCAYGAALGGLAGFFAWLIRRPDRDAPNLPTSGA